MSGKRREIAKRTTRPNGAFFFQIKGLCSYSNRKGMISSKGKRGNSVVKVKGN
jgi:hypothetical protein